MADGDQARVGQPAHHLLGWRPPGRSGRFVVGGWSLEAWYGSDCVWAMELAGLGAYFWVDTELAKTVAARVLRGHRVAAPGWLSCGGGDRPMYRAVPAPVVPAQMAPRIRPAGLADGPRGRRSPSPAGVR